MFRAIGWLIKLSIFAGIILVLGNMVHWRGHTVSDQVKTSLAAAQQSDTLDDIKTWANHITSAPGHSTTHLKSAKKRALLQESPRNSVHPVMTSTAATTTQPAADTEDARAQQEEIPSSERQKLRALIRELNTSQTN